MEHDQADQGGWRERKRRETLARITASALKLFVASGYEATTLDAIAAASGISRRTFFYYFKSKEEILAAWQRGLPEAFGTAMLAQSTDQSPLDAVRNAHLKLVAEVDADQALLIDTIIRSNDQLQVSNQAKYLQLEQVAFAALCTLWPDGRLRASLRKVAMVGVGALRLAIDRWAEEGGRSALASHVEEAFAGLQVELSIG